MSWILFCTLFWLVTLSSGACPDNLDSPLVFDAIFYLNNHPDLEAAGYNTPDGAINHWCSQGILEGRQATSSFHVLQYLENFPDLAAIFGGDYFSAAIHYIKNGASEGRIGYKVGGGYNRWTVRSNGKPGGQRVYVSASARTAGAIDSLVWNNKEFINSYDHGRQLQLAVIVAGFGECWNPTEAGGESDGIGFPTKSELLGIVSEANVLKSTSHPAYWVRGNGVSSGDSGPGCPKGHASYNNEDTHRFPASKQVTIGCFGMDHCIQFAYDVNLGNSPQMPSGYAFAQLEAPTAYMSNDFSAVSWLNVKTGKTHPGSSGEDSRPVIIHTPDNQFALGAIAPQYDHPTTPGLQYAYFSFPMTQFDQKCWKWSVVVRKPLAPNDHFNGITYLCVGNLEMVTSCMMTVHQNI